MNYQYNYIVIDMQMRKYSLSRKLKVFIFFILIGILIGFIYFNNINQDDLKVILNNVKNDKLIILNNHSNITDHLKIISLIITFNFIYIGIFLFAGLLICEGFKVTIKSIFFYKIYKFSGLIYYLIYYFITNIIYMIILYIIFKKIIKITKLFYKRHIKGETINYLDIIGETKKTIYYLLIITISDFIIYLNYQNIAKLFAFLIK